MSKESITPDSPGYATERAGVNKEDLHKEMMERHEACRDYWHEQFELAREDMKFAFVPESQWDEWMATSRKGRPMYTVNKVRQSMKQVTNDQRQNRPQAKVRAEEGGDTELAEVRQGLLRNIDSQLDAQRAVDTAFQFAVGGGYGVWRITTSYQEDGGFDQVIQREEIQNPYSVMFDPAAKKKDRRDARYAFIDTTWARSAFRDKWPDAKLVSVDDCTDATKDWFDEKDLTVSEYLYKEATDVEIVLMSDGSVYDASEISLIVDELAKSGVTEQRRRIVERTKVMHCIVTGAEIVEGPKELPGRFIPIVPVWGELLNIEGKDIFFGDVRFAKDPQRMYNYERSALIEVIADQGYSPYMATPAMVEGLETQWQQMRTKRSPLLLYNVDQNAPNGGAPNRLAPPDFPVALANAANMSSDDIKAVTGRYDASLGARSNETSGKAIIARERQGDVASFDYLDNLTYALKYDFEIMNDLIPKIYDTQRQLRIIGEDGQEKVVEANKVVLDAQTGQQVTLNDMQQGRYDVAVTVGPSYTTQRMEMAEAMQSLVNAPGPGGMLAMYGFLKSLDSPGMDEITKGYRKTLVAQGLLEPAEDDQPTPPPPPNPKDVAETKLKDAQTGKTIAETQQILAETPAVVMKAHAEADRATAEAFGSVPGPDAPGIPIDPAQFDQPNQPPQGGFLLPDQSAPPINQGI